MRRRAFLSAAATAAVAAAHPARGAGEPGRWPERRITLVVPYAAGGSTDIAARLLAEKLGAEFGQTIVVENRPGAGSNIGAASVARAAPDGHTFLLATSALAANVSLYGSMGFDFRRDLVPVCEVVEVPNVLVVNKDLASRTLAAFIAYARANPGRITYGSSGSGGSQHLAAKLFEKMAGVEMMHVPYRGGAPANVDLMAGQIQAVFAPLVEVLGTIEEGALRALAVTTPERVPRLPDVPTVAESLPGYELVLWNALFAPARTPGPIVERVAAAARKVLADPAVRRTFADQGSKVVASTPAEFQRFVSAEIDKWGELVALSGAKVD